MSNLTATASKAGQKSKMQRARIALARDMKRNYSLYLLVLPVLVFYAIFCYAPMYGAIIAFKDFSPAEGILGSPWVGFNNFKDFFQSVYFGRVLGNTLRISVVSLIFGFPAPILLALFINELRSKAFSKTVQTITYLPYFISLVVICGIIKDFTNETGVISDLLSLFGVERQTMLNNPKLFLPI